MVENISLFYKQTSSSLHVGRSKAAVATWPHTDESLSTLELSSVRVLVKKWKHAVQTWVDDYIGEVNTHPASILRKSTSGRHRPVSYPDGPMTARYRFT